ncbi:hypothetical protein [Pseudoxanthomonas composti]|uniref:Uncharacterized protein n=1 Tax=Pseudoxanthomonas composti TaxID=2137479 RepID=A0A4V1N0N9_9GAMM|nr:hypothetical protein [Pseudoxanthomonas composti]RXQ99877.1 hypothetical protein EPA99_17280 [Pseudoxanthomonas composti]
MPYEPSIEDRLFRRGVTDGEVRQAMDLVREYLEDNVDQSGSDYEWWVRFEEFFTELCRPLSIPQLDAMEIAADSMLVHLGLPPWSMARIGLAVSRKGVADPDPVDQGSGNPRMTPES